MHTVVNNDVNVLVSGASVAGLSTAWWLAHFGFRVTVVEQAPYLRPGGQALDVRGPALEVAERMGILSRLRDRSTRLHGVSAVNAEGQEIFRSTERTFTGGRFDSPDIEILRDDLCSVLHEAVRNRVEFLFVERVAAVTHDEMGVDVAFVKAAPRRFELVIGADGLYSGIRRLVFGPDRQFLRFVGQLIAVFSAPNFLGLDHWQVFYAEGDIGGLVLATDKDAEARVYLGFSTAELPEYDYRDVTAQKRLIAERLAGGGWELPRLLTQMWDAPDFYFYATNQVLMDSWSRGRVALVGDAGYSVSPATGQGTTVAMVGAYVLAGELVAHKPALVAGLGRYESELRDYVLRNQELAFSMSDAALHETPAGQSARPDRAAHAGELPDFGQVVLPFALKSY